MSRSYKKSPVFGDHANKWVKRQANKAARKNNNLSNGSMYKKCYETWNIRDFVFALWGYTEREICAFMHSKKGKSK